MRPWFAPLLAVGISLCAHAASAAQFSLSWPGSGLNNVVMEATVSMVNGVEVATVTSFVSGTAFGNTITNPGAGNPYGHSGTTFFVQKQNGSHFNFGQSRRLTFNAGSAVVSIWDGSGGDSIYYNLNQSPSAGYAEISNLSAVPLPEFASSPLAKLAALALMALIALGLVRARRARPSPAVA